MGLLDIFDKIQFRSDVASCYSNPLNSDPSFLCLLYLVYSIGIVLASPIPGSPEDTMIKRLRSHEQDWAELFYQKAKHLDDPTHGLEDAGLWAIRALVLMSVYMLSIFRRNASYGYYGKYIVYS